MRLIDFVHNSTLGLRVIRKTEEVQRPRQDLEIASNSGSFRSEAIGQLGQYEPAS